MQIRNRKILIFVKKLFLFVVDFLQENNVEKSSNDWNRPEEFDSDSDGGNLDWRIDYCRDA